MGTIRPEYHPKPATTPKVKARQASKIEKLVGFRKPLLYPSELQARAESTAAR
jgi:hypothetical protein